MTSFDGADRLGAEADGDGDGRAAATRSSYDKNWKIFERFCTSLNLPSLPASLDVVQMFVAAAGSGALRRPGKSRLQTGEPTPLATQTLEVSLSAIRDRHVRAGYPSPTEAAVVRQLRRQYRADRAADGYQVRKAPSLSVSDVRALCSSVVPASSVSVAAFVLSVLAVPGLSGAGLASTRLRDLDCGEVVRLRAGSRWVTVPCSCRAGWGRWDVAPCAACLLRKLELEVDAEDELLFGGWQRSGSRRAPEMTAQLVASKFRVLATRLPAAWPALEYRWGKLQWAPTVDEAGRVATMQGLGLALTDQLVWLQFRSLLLAMLLRGLRFDDAARLPRRPVARHAGSYRVLLPAAKNDPTGKGRWLRLPPTDDEALCVVCALDEWVPILEAAGAVERSGALFAPVNDIGVRVDASLTYSVAWQLLNRMQMIAGVGPVSLHSMRRSFANVAYGQGASLEELQEALGHARIDTTAGYVDLSTVGEIPTGVLGMAGADVAPRRAPKYAPQVERPHCRADHAEQRDEPARRP